ncbi:RCC1 and BTB domain-containing protein 2-like [Cloeon dipterum]|uniref:RCC1 and BTB domain-containing protein 2-like n=1 Tax=Cloeon dipterum TaxID=197152 RepID=UPI00321FBD9D
MSKLLEKWANFGYQKSEIRTAIVFGKNGENVIIVLANDEVFAFGKNKRGCLGVGNLDEVDELKRIENLCGQGIEGLECGIFDRDKFHMLAISGSGSVFSWGNNGSGQLGLGTKECTEVPTKISGCLEHKKVVQVACGGYHTLTLTSEGEVYAFGCNAYGQLGLGSKDNQLLPQRVGGLLDGIIVASVACQKYSSFALLQSGKICAWGYNRDCFLGSSSTSEHECSPCKVIGLEGVVISQIVCADFFILALSDDGKIYSWGVIYNSHSEKRIWLNRPTIITTEMGRVKDIAATHYGSHPSAAITEDDKVYIWGNCNGQLVLKPIVTSFSSFDEVFATASPSVTYQRFPMKITEDESKRKCPISKRFPEVFDNPETADFAFIVEGKKIHVHKIILILVSDVFKNLFLGDWKDSCQKELIVEDHSYDAFYAFLKYFYTGKVNFTAELALDVYTVARFYLVTDLMEVCKKILKSGLTLQNASFLYEKATLLGAKDLCEVCVKFCEKRWVDVMDNFESDDRKREVVMEVFRWFAAGKKN